MSTSVQTLIGSWSNAVLYPKLDPRLIEFIFPTNVYVNTLTYVNLASEQTGAYTYILEAISGSGIPTLDLFAEDGMVRLDSTPVSSTTVQTNFWALGFDLPQAVNEDIQYSVMNQYTKRLMLKAAYTRDKHVEQALSTAFTGAQTSAVTGVNYGYQGSFTISGVMGTTDVVTGERTISKNNVEANTFIAPSVNCVDLYENPLFTAALYYGGQGDSGVNSGLATIRQSMAPVGKIRNSSVWASNVTTAQQAYFLATGAEGVVPNNQFSTLGFFVDKRPPMTQSMYWQEDDNFRIRLTARFIASVARNFHGFKLTSLSS